MAVKESVSGKMKSICVLLGLLALTLADPTVYFVEKFETGGRIDIRSKNLLQKFRLRVLSYHITVLL